MWSLNGTEIDLLEAASIIIGRSDGTGTLTVNADVFDDPMTFRMSGAGGDVTTVGAVTTEAANASLTFAAGTGDGGTFTQTAANTIRTGSGALTITADSIVLNSTADTITSTGAITLQPASAGRPIVVGAPGAATDFALSAAEVASLTDGATSITIGRSDSTVGATISAITFNDPVTIRSPSGGTIAVTGDLTGAGDASVSLDGSGATTNLTADITTAGQDITINDNVRVGADGSGDPPVTLSTGAAVGGNISITGTTDSVVGQTNPLQLISGSGTTTLANAVGNQDSLSTLTLQADDPGAIAFNGSVTANSVVTFDQGYDVAFNAGGTITNDTNFLNTGTVTLGDDDADSITFSGGLATTGNASNPATVNVAGTVRTTNTQMDLGEITLTGDTELDTGTAAASIMNVGAVTGGGSALTLDSGGDAAADITVASVDDVSTLTIRDSGDTTFTGTVGAGTSGAVTITDTTGTVAFQDNATITTLTTANQPYNVSFTGATNSVTTDTSFLNTGTLTLGNASTDAITFAGGLATTGSASNPTTVNVAGTVATTTTQMDLGAITLVGDSELDTGTAAASILNVGAVTGGGFALTLDSGADAAADITVASVDDVSTLTIRDSGDTTITGTVGAGTAGAVTITDTTGTVAFQDNATITTLTTANQTYNVSFTGAANSVATGANFLNTGTVTLGDASADSITFTGGLATAGNASNPTTVNVAGTVATTNTQMELGAVTLTADAELDHGHRRRQHPQRRRGDGGRLCPDPRLGGRCGS